MLDGHTCSLHSRRGAGVSEGLTEEVEPLVNGGHRWNKARGRAWDGARGRSALLEAVLEADGTHSYQLEHLDPNLAQTGCVAQTPPVVDRGDEPLFHLG